MRSKRATVVAALALAVGLVIGTAAGGFAGGSGVPADKVTAAGSTLAIVAPGAAHDLLTATMRTSKPTDLILQVAAECEIYTSHTRDGKTTYNKAAGTVRVWVEIDNKIVPVTAISSPPQDGSTPEVGTDADKATFCEREEEYEKTDNNSLCIADDALVLAGTGCEMEEWFQRVKSANAFNWVKMNVGSGIHTIKVRADIITSTSATTPGEASTARAAVGNRTLVVEPTKMANDAVIGPSGSS
ncbi:MAG: hypothetical protein KY443_12185 [Actinobacteria bacterium]|nr:hypothetical protein [Actinomycetota bacterium]